jgi:hypothetical protein
MGSGQQVIEILDIVLLVVAILVGGRIFFLLGDVRHTLTGIDATRTEISGTLKRVDTVVDTTEHLLREQLAPTLTTAREALANLAVTSHALAETTQIIRKAAGAVEDAQRFLSGTGPIAQSILRKASGVAGGLMSGISSGIRSVLGKGKSPKEKGQQLVPASDHNIAILGTDTTNPVLHADSREVREDRAVRRKR